MPEVSWTPVGELFNGTHYSLSGPATSTNYVVLIHGNNTGMFFYDGLAKHLEEHEFRVLRYDLIGRGFSSNHVSEKFDEEAYLDQLRQLLDHVKFSKPFHLIAHSLGGSLATIFTSRFPNEVKSLTLLAPAGLLSIPVLNLLRNGRCIRSVVKAKMKARSKREQRWRGDFVQHSGEYLERENEAIQKMHLMFDRNPSAFDAFFESIIQFPICGIDQEVREISLIPGLPVHLVWGKNDVSANFKSFENWKNILSPGSCEFSATLMDDAGHSFLLEYPEESYKDILGFLTSSVVEIK